MKIEILRVSAKLLRYYVQKYENNSDIIHQRQPLLVFQTTNYFVLKTCEETKLEISWKILKEISCRKHAVLTFSKVSKVSFIFRIPTFFASVFSLDDISLPLFPCCS